MATKAKKKAEKPMTDIGAPSERETISVRKITNGYLVCKSRSGKDGYSETEFYTAKKPEIEVPKAKGMKD